jgi:hypothetical protein
MATAKLHADFMEWEARHIGEPTSQGIIGNQGERDDHET